MKKDLLDKRQLLNAVAILSLVLLTLFLRVFNSSDLSGGDDSQWAELATYAIQDPRLIIYPHFPDEPIQWQNIHHSRPFAVLPYVISILLFGYTKFAIIFSSAIFSALSVIFLCLLLRRLFDDKVAYLAGFLFAVSPFHLAFSRIGLLDAALIFYCLFAFWLLIRGLETGKLVFIYLSAFVWFINSTTTNIRGVVPILAVLPCIYFYLIKRKFDLRNLFRNRLFRHILISHVCVFLFFLAYIMLPLTWGDSGWIDVFRVMAQNAAGIIPGRDYMGFVESIYSMGSILIFTPFLGLIFVPLISGLVISLREIKKFRYAFWLFYIVGIIFFYTQGQFAPHRQTIFLPAIVTFAALGMLIPYYAFIKRRNSYFLPLVLSLSFAYLPFMLFMFSRRFEAEFVGVNSAVRALGLGGVFHLTLSFWWVFMLLIFIFLFGIYLYSKRPAGFMQARSIYITIIFLFIVLNLGVSLALVVSGAGIYKRTDATSVVGNYLKDNLGDEKYSCVAGVHAKSFSFYTQRTCAFWVDVNVSWLEEKAKAGDLKYFILNTHYPGGTSGFGNILPDGTMGPELAGVGWEINHQDKYEWLQENAIDITDKVGLSGRDEFLVYEFRI